MTFYVGEAEDLGTDQGMVFTLRVLASWKKCSFCRRLVLYVDARGMTDDDFICGDCIRRRESFAHELTDRLR